MSTADLTKPPTGPEPERPRTVLDHVRGPRSDRPTVDPTAPIRPEWLQTWDAFRPTAVLALRRWWWRIRRFLLHLPMSTLR